jgi:hypothetical protein
MDRSHSSERVRPEPGTSRHRRRASDAVGGGGRAQHRSARARTSRRCLAARGLSHLYGESARRIGMGRGRARSADARGIVGELVRNLSRHGDPALPPSIAQRATVRRGADRSTEAAENPSVRCTCRTPSGRATASPRPSASSSMQWYSSRYSSCDDAAVDAPTRAKQNAASACARGVLSATIEAFSVRSLSEDHHGESPRHDAHVFDH